MTTPSPHGSYPTEPPWAPSPPPPAPPAAPWGPEAWSGHGRLLVPYPEEIALANRSRPPSWVPVAIWTFLFFPIGFLSARRRARKALIGQNDRHPYWIAFGVTLAVSTVLSLILSVSVAVPAYLQFRAKAQAKAVASALVEGGVASSADCTRTGDTVGGLGLYSCEVTLGDGRTGTIQVRADADGRLQPA